MLRAFLVVALLLPPTLASAQQQPADQPAAQPPTPAQLMEDARILYVARMLRLREDQVAKIIPLLNQAQEVLRQRDAALDDLWIKYEGAFVAANRALLGGETPAPAAQTALDRAVNAHDDARGKARNSLEMIAEQITRLLDQQQVSSLETLRHARAGEQGQQRAGDAASIIFDVQRYVVAMRQLLPDEYQTLRVAMALRLAAELVAPDDQGYNSAVSDVLRLMDSVRRLSDAQFAQLEPRLPQAIVRALRLPETPAKGGWPVSFEDFMVFISSERTVALLQGFKAEPAMEVVP